MRCASACSAWRCNKTRAQQTTEQMQHESLFSVELDWKVELGPDNERLVVSEGRASGAINGTFRCSSIVGTSDAYGDMRATIDTDDGTTVHFRRAGGWIDL